METSPVGGEIDVSFGFYFSRVSIREVRVCGRRGWGRGGMKSCIINVYECN